MHLSVPSTSFDSPGRDTASIYIDALLQDTYLFVMNIYHQHAQIRDEALYLYAVKLVETVQESLQAAKENDDFIHHVIYAQCAMMDDAVLNTASQSENAVWLNNPLQARFVMQMQAGEVMFERVWELLHQAAPDPRLLVLYQRLFGMGFSQRWSERYREKTPDGQDKREHARESLNRVESVWNLSVLPGQTERGFFTTAVAVSAQRHRANHAVRENLAERCAAQGGAALGTGCHRVSGAPF